MKKCVLAAATAVAMVVSGAASAATFSVFDNPGGQALAAQTNIANFGIYTPVLFGGDSVSVTFEAENIETFTGIGFNFTPVGSTQAFEVGFTSTDFNDFGPTTIHLSSSSSLSDSFASDTISSAFDFAVLSGISAASPFYLLFEFATPTIGSFTGDLTIAPVPLPASLALLLAGLGGLGVMRRRKSA